MTDIRADNQQNMKTPLEYGRLACDTFMRRYAPQKLPPEGALFYHQGVCLSGFERIYKLCGERKYFDYIKAYVDSVIGENGEIPGICHELTTEQTPALAKMSLTMLDSKQPVILLYNLYDETGCEKYLNAIKTISRSMYYWPVNMSGGYWHMMTQHNQMWLDGAYMAGPMSVMYSVRFNDQTLMRRAIKQIYLMNAHMRDFATGLYYHGWDESKAECWADEVTGCSGQFWGRAIGWYAVAILDMLDYIPKDCADAERLRGIVRDLLDALLNYQDSSTGMWYNVTDRTDDAANWLESSCTNLFIYAYAKALRTGILCGEKYEAALEKAYRGSIASTSMDENGIVIDKVCIGTCINEGTYEHYTGAKQVKNDLHGGGAFILMCAEMEEYRRRKNNGGIERR